MKPQEVTFKALLITIGRKTDKETRCRIKSRLL